MVLTKVRLFYPLAHVQWPMEKWHMLHKIRITGCLNSIYHNTWIRRTCGIYGQIPDLRRHVVKTGNLVNKWRICGETVSYDILPWSSLWLLRARPKAERVLLRIRENPEYERPAGRPAVVTLLRDLYLWNQKPDWQAVFFRGYPHPFCRVWDQCRIMLVPTVARGACYLGGGHKCSACCFSVTAGPIALKFGMHSGTH